MPASKPFELTRTAILQDKQVAALYVEEALADGNAVHTTGPAHWREKIGQITVA